MIRWGLTAVLLLLRAQAGWSATRVEMSDAGEGLPSVTVTQPGVERIELPIAPLAPPLGLSSPDATQIEEIQSEAEAPASDVLTAPLSPLAPLAPAIAGDAGAEPAAATAAPGGFAARVHSILSRLSNPFGTKKESADAPAPTPEQESYTRFEKKNLWNATAEASRAEISRVRELKSKVEVQAYLRQAGQQIIGKIEQRHGTSNIGFHFNLHGGTAQGYVDGAGIRATMGDIANNYSMNGDKNLKVYFFQSKNVQLYDVLNETNPALLFFPSRMGSGLSLFKLDSPELAQAMADGRIKNFGAISMDFHGMRGVPYSSFIAPPLDVFNRVGKKIGMKGRLSRDEETLAVMRYIEAAALSDERFVP